MYRGTFFCEKEKENDVKATLWLVFVRFLHFLRSFTLFLYFYYYYYYRIQIPIKCNYMLSLISSKYESRLTGKLVERRKF